MKRHCVRAGVPGAALFFALALQATGAAAADPVGGREQSRQGRERTVSVTGSVLTPFFGAYEFEAKIRASRYFAAFVNTSYLTLEKDDWKTKTGTVGAGLNYYFAGTALRGWYVEGVGELMLSSWRHQPSREVAPVVLGYTGIASVGYQFICDAGPVLDLAAGVVALHFPSAHIEREAGSVSSKAFTAVYPGAKVNVGWAF